MGERDKVHYGGQNCHIIPKIVVKCPKNYYGRRSILRPLLHGILSGTYLLTQQWNIVNSNKTNYSLNLFDCQQRDFLLVPSLEQFIGNNFLAHILQVPYDRIYLLRRQCKYSKPRPLVVLEMFLSWHLGHFEVNTFLLETDERSKLLYKERKTCTYTPIKS